MRTVSFIISAFFVFLNSTCVVAQSITSQKNLENNVNTIVKWHPGHYSLASDEKTPREQYIQGKFLGLQKKYPWKQLEPKKGVYDFSIIHSDLQYLQKHGKRLVIQLQTKDFGQDQMNAPEYLKDKEFNGGLYLTSTGSLNPVLWNRKVADRIEALYRALGKEFDSEPFVEAIVIPETAISSDIQKKDQKGIEHYTPEKFATALKQQMKVLKVAFPTTVVIQFTNFPKEVLGELTSFQKENGIGLGGPDINLYSKGLNDPLTGVYLYYDSLAGYVPLGSAVQSEDYTYGKTEKYNGSVERPSVEQIYAFGRDRLHLNYIFWLIKPGYFDKVVTMMNRPDFPKDATGGLKATLPSFYTLKKQ